jgi:hypothetical protein
MHYHSAFSIKSTTIGNLFMNILEYYPNLQEPHINECIFANMRSKIKDNKAYRLEMVFELNISVKLLLEFLKWEFIATKFQS